MIEKIHLDNLTLCAVSSVNIDQTLKSLIICGEKISFRETILLTSENIPLSSESIRIIKISKLSSGKDYSHFILTELHKYVQTDFILLVQWDGFICDAKFWRTDFLDYDYIGAPWPQFSDDQSVGNGGFSIRSRKLLQACNDPHFKMHHPEDVCICRSNRALLEDKYNIRIADESVAIHFSFERTRPPHPTFGFHGAFNMISVMGTAAFWDAYETLDDRNSLFADYRSIVRSALMGAHQAGLRRTARMLVIFTRDYLLYKSRRKSRQN